MAGRNLKTEEWHIRGIRVHAEFFELRKNQVLFNVTAGFNKGHSPQTVDSGKSHSKTEAMFYIRKNVLPEVARKIVLQKF